MISKESAGFFLQHMKERSLTSLGFVGIPLLKQSFDLVSLDSSWAEIDFEHLKYWIVFHFLEVALE